MRGCERSVGIDHWSEVGNWGIVGDVHRREGSGHFCGEKSE